MPQLGIGGCAPKPKKLNPVSNKIAEAKFAEATTKIGPAIFGKICLIIVLCVENPNAFAASNPTGTLSLKRLNTTFDWSSSEPTTVTWSPLTDLYTDAGATAYDASEGDISSSLVMTALSGSFRG